MVKTDILVNTTTQASYIKCKKCGTKIFGNTHKKMTPCACGAVEVDGCEDYVRVLGNKEDYVEIKTAQ